MNSNEQTLLLQDYRQRKPVLDKVTDEKITQWNSGSVGRQEYQHTQTIASTVWEIQHNLNCQYVDMKIFDTDGNRIYGEIQYYSSNLTKINFDTSIAGNAIANT